MAYLLSVADFARDELLAVALYAIRRATDVADVDGALRAASEKGPDYDIQL